MKRKISNNILYIFLCILICCSFVFLTTKANETTFYYDFINDMQTFVAPKTGKYYIEAYGASGGGATSKTASGYGGFVSGYVNLKQGETIYIYVGGSGQQTANGASGGYNGGGKSTNAAGSGGGATHIAKVSGLLNTLKNNKDVTQDKTLFVLNDGISNENPIITNGSIIAPYMTAGNWKGNLNFDIKFNRISEIDSVGSVKEDMIGETIVGQDEMQDKETSYVYGVENEKINN